MAIPATINTLTEELIAAVTKIDNKNTSLFLSLKRRAEDTIKSGSHGRTDQFAVAKQLDGVQEKFQILNKDELADALRIRLTELEERRGSWFPEILSLLLQLSDRPTQLSRIDQIRKLKPQEDVKTLSWSELDVSESAYCDEDIWEHVNFGADSSDDDVSSVHSDTSPTQTLPHSPIAPEEDYEIPHETFTSGEDEQLVASIKNAQFWKAESDPSLVKHGKVASLVLTELQIIRETIFMLQGLPTSLFWRLDESVEVDRRYTLAHSSSEALSSLLRSFSLVGAKIDALRRFMKTPQVIPYVQTFHRGVESCLYEFDTFLSNVQSQYLSQSATVSVSLLQLLEDVRRTSRILLLLADLVSNLKHNASEDSVRCLDLLYYLVCMSQATGDDYEFKFLADLFFSCLETYLRPIRLWMEQGQLDLVDGAFFIIDNRKDGDLRTLWYEWYTLDEACGLLRAPKFLQPVARKIFTTGKNMVFLQHLNVVENLESPNKTSLTFQDIYPQGSPSSLCLPFPELLESAFQKMVDVDHSYTSDLLRKELDQQCGLWISLQALEHIYLCKDMSIFGTIDGKIFDLIDRGRGAWNDRFLLTELAQSAFSTMSFIDPSRIIVRSSQVSPENPGNRSRSVKILKAISFDYILPWPVANVITKDAILSYQRISTFLMQIRRSKHLIIKQRLQYTDETDQISSDRTGDTLGYAIRHNMLWFLNTFYSHITDFVISTSTESLRRALSSSTDVDAMIAAHRSYMSSLEVQCLLSKNLSPLYQATMNLLDLCVYFADIQSTRYGENQFDPSRTPRKYGKIPRGGNGNSQTRKKYRSTFNDEDQSDEDEDEFDDSDSNVDVGNTTTISFYETPYVHRLKDIKSQFDQLVSFLAAGLKGVGRVDGQISWEILAEKLEWRKERAL